MNNLLKPQREITGAHILNLAKSELMIVAACAVLYAVFRLAYEFDLIGDLFGANLHNIFCGGTKEVVETSLIFSLVVVYLIYTNFQIVRLAKYGVLTRARVVKRFRQGATGFVVEYPFEDEIVSMTRWISTSHQHVPKEFEENAPFDILVHPRKRTKWCLVSESLKPMKYEEAE